MNYLKYTCAFLLAFLKEYRETVRWQFGILLSLPIVCGSIAHFSQWKSGIAAFLTLIIFLIWPNWKRSILLTALFLAWWGWLAVQFSKPPPFPNKKMISGIATSFSSNKFSQRFLLLTDFGKGVIYNKKPANPIMLGETIQAFGRFRPVTHPANPGQFDYPAYLASQGCHWVFQADSIAVLKGPGKILGAVGTVRSYLMRSLEATIAPEVLPLVKASLLGTRYLLHDNVKEAFANSGMFHLLAISGLHVGLIAFILIRLGFFLRLSRKAAYLFSAVLLTLYVPVCGASISIVRAVLMFWCVTFSIFRERPPFSLHNLGLTCAICLVIMPYQILSLGFQLSFCATFFLLFYAPSVSKWIGLSGFRSPVIKTVLVTLMVSLVLFFATLPPLAGTIHQVSPLAVIGNVATLFLTTCMVMTAGLSLLLYPLGSFPAIWMGETCSLSAQTLMFVVDKISSLYWSHFFMPALGWATSTLVYTLLLLLPFAIKKGLLRPFALSTMLILSSGFAARQVFNLLTAPGEIVYLDVGQGDAIFCNLPGGFKTLIDAGPGQKDRGAGKTVILPFLKQAGVRSLDLVIISHADWDHFSGLEYLVPRVKIKRVLYQGDEAYSHSWRRLQNRLDELGIPLIKAQCGDTLYRHHHAVLSAVHPCPGDAFHNRNNNSLVILLNLHGSRHLFTGDIEAEAENFLVQRLNTSIDVLKIPHHGSSSGSTEWFLKAVEPELGIVSAGRRNRYGHPDSAVLRRLREREIKIISTFKAGAILFSCRRGGCGPPETHYKHGGDLQN